MDLRQSHYMYHSQDMALNNIRHYYDVKITLHIWAIARD